MTAVHSKYMSYIKTELMTCFLGRKHQNLVLFWKYSIPMSMFQKYEDILLVESIIIDVGIVLGKELSGNPVSGK